MSAIEYLEELDAKATTWESRVQLACAQAIVEAIREQTAVIKESLRTRPKSNEQWLPSGSDMADRFGGDE